MGKFKDISLVKNRRVSSKTHQTISRRMRHIELQQERVEEAWCRGLLTWKLHSGQEKVEAEYNKVNGKLFVANCARRFGKTYWACVKALEKAIRVENAQIWYVSGFLNNLRKFVIPTFEQILADCPLEIAPEWKRTVKELHFKNGSVIHLVGLDRNPDGIRGNYADLVVFEEAREISRLGYLYSSVVIPMTMYRDSARVVMISTPSDTPAHEFQEFCEKARMNDAYVKLTLYENPLVTQEMIEELKRELDDEAFQRECLCEFVVDANRAIIREWQDIFETDYERPIYFEHLHKYESMDIGVKDLTAILFAYYDFPRAACVVEREADISGPSMTTDKVAALVSQVEGELWCDPIPPPPMLTSSSCGDEHPCARKREVKVYRRVADNNNPLLLNDLGQLHGLHFVPTGKDNLDAMVNELRWFISQGRLLVNPRCKKTIGAIKYGIWDKKRKSFAKSKVFGHFDHLAALIYLVRNLDQHTDPVPKGIGIKKETHHILPIGQPLSQVARAFKKVFRINK
jgi:hypothetical protein